MNKLQNKFTLLARLNVKPYISKEDSQFVIFNVSISVPNSLGPEDFDVDSLYTSRFWETINLFAPSNKLTVSQFNLTENQNIFIEGHLQKLILDDLTLVGMIDGIDTKINSTISIATNSHNEPFPSTPSSNSPFNFSNDDTIKSNADSSSNFNKNSSNKNSPFSENINSNENKNDKKVNLVDPFSNDNRSNSANNFKNNSIENSNKSQSDPGDFELPF